MAKYLELLAPRVGKDGKTFWLRIGTAFPSKEGPGFSMVLDAYPLPDKDNRVSFIARPPKPREGASNADTNLSDQLNDDVPF